MNKKSVVFATSAVSLGLATVLTLSAVAPSMAATSHKTTKSVSASSSKSKAKSGAAFSISQDARQFTSVNFKITNVPSSITDAATAAKLLVVKVVPLASDATAAPATAPVPSFSGKTGDVRASAPAGAPAFGNGHAPDNDGDGPGANGGQGGNGGWTPLGTSGTTGTTSGTTGTTGTTAPTFSNGQGPDNDGDGPRGGHGHGPHGGPGGPRGMQLGNLSLSNGVLTGTIQIPGDEVANVQKWGIYLSIAADSTNGIVAQSSTPVMVTVTTAADLTASVTATSGDVVLNLGN